MDWVEGFYSRTGAWWGEAESGIGEVDRRRAAALLDIGGSGASVLELGCGYGSSARACAAVGLEVTAIDLSDRIQFATAAALSDNPRFVRVTPNTSAEHQSLSRRYTGDRCQGTVPVDSLEEVVEEGGAVGLVVVAGVVALAEEDGHELGSGLEVGAGLAG